MAGVFFNCYATSPMSIGILNEGPLHAALKATYAANGGSAEVQVEQFVADAVRNGTMYEVQTGSFSGLGDEGTCGKPRTSPKHGALVHIVNELVYMPQMLNHPNFSVEVVLTEEQEIRIFDPKKNRRRGGWRVVERQLLDIVDGVRLHQMEDLYGFLDSELQEPFGTRQLAAALAQPVAIARKMAYCLRHAGVTDCRQTR